MRKALLDLLKCLNCDARALTLDQSVVNETEVRAGLVVCRRCQHVYRIENGILDMRPEAIKLGWEKVQENVVGGADDSWLLNSELGYRNAPDSHSGHFSFGMMLNFDKAVSEMHLVGTEVLLDLGAGTTWLTNSLAQKGPYCVAMDLASQKYVGLESADVFMTHHGTYYERVLADMHKLPYGDAVFDIVFSHSTLHHSIDLDRVLSQVYSVLKPGGCFFMLNEPTLSIGKLFDAPLSEEEVLRGENPCSFWQYVRSIRRAGFRQLEVYYPPSLSRRLDALASGGSLGQPEGIGQAVKYAMARSFLSFWQISPIAKYLTEHFLFWPYLFVVGYFSILKAHKVDASASSSSKERAMRKCVSL